MKQLRKILRWIESNKDLCFDAMRIYLGIGLAVKGLQFALDTEFLTTTLRDSTNAEFKFLPIETFIAHYIPLAHIGGGLLLAAGLLTRISTLFQIPVLVGAAFVIYGRDGIFSHNQEFQFTALVLFLLILILLHGGGRLSVDFYLKTH